MTISTYPKKTGEKNADTGLDSAGVETTQEITGEISNQIISAGVETNPAITGEASLDLIPGAYDFTDATNQNLNTLIASNIVQIADIEGPAAVTISGDGSPQYRTCNDGSCSSVIADWSSSAGTIANNKYIQLRATSENAYAAESVVEVDIGGVEADWSITTMQDTVPEAYDFTDLTDQLVSTQVTSNIVQITGLGAAAAVTISGDGSPQYRTCNDGSCSSVIADWSSSAGTIANNKYIQLRLTTDDENEVESVADISVGGVAADWSVTTEEAAAGFTPLGDLVASTVTDMSVVAGYSGSGTAWPNFEATPADSETQESYDMTLNGLTFNGSAGVPGAYFSADGNDYAELTSGTNTTFLNGLHKNAAGTWWAAAVIKLPTTVNDELHTLWATAAAGNETGMTALLGANSSGADSSITVRQQKGGSSANKGSGDVMPTGGSYMIVMSHDQGANETRIWVNGAQQGSGAHTYVASTTADATDVLRLLKTLNYYPAQSGTRLYEFSMGNAYLDDAGEALIRAEYELRTGLDLTN